ncbi:MAG: class I SAM-dependent methyltransferase [Terracidiphilus sp.]
MQTEVRLSDALFDHAVERLHATRLSPVARCKVCGGEAHPFDILDFNKSCDCTLYPNGMSATPVIYRLCSECQFIFTDFYDTFTDEQWRSCVYNEEYLRIDPDYAEVRPRAHAREIIALLVGRKNNIIGLDYGGGNGMTTALLREQGWSFDSYDPFGHSDMSPDRIGRYNFCSAMQVFEHTPDPVGTLRAIIEKSSPGRLMILIGTGTHDGIVSKKTRLSWWYAAPRNGHISLYSRKSLQILCASFGLNCSSMSSGTFLLTRGIGEWSARTLLLRGKLLRRLRSALNIWSGGLA